ncbi:hypothetical protein [Natronomonas amylolytica]|uniref:hypothetical protein n=1 Tax=Natronomonas amylolytica TaxID=3108498 RepID=UPI00300AF887
MSELLLGGTAAFLVGTLLILLRAYRQDNIPAVVNAVFSFVVAVVPLLVEGAVWLRTGQRVGVAPALPFWLAAVGCLHSYGMLGPYDTVWWWDHLTHTMAGALVAALVYSGLVVAGQHADVVELSTAAVGGLTVFFTFVVGIVWELGELVARAAGERYDVEPVLVYYGWRDTALDLVFDIVGALAVVAFDVGILVPAAERFPRVTTTLLLGGGVVVVVGGVLLALVVLYEAAA